MPPTSLRPHKLSHSSSHWWSHGILQSCRPSKKASSPANKAKEKSQTIDQRSMEGHEGFDHT
jgi:hypothetical protein